MNDFNKKADPELIIVIVLILVVMGVYYFYLYREYDKNRKKLQEKKGTGQCPDYWRVLTAYSSSPAATSGCENTQRIGLMPHNGFRPFSHKLLKKNFPHLKSFSFKKILKEHIKKI